jgi:hypothetical protein
MRKIQTRKVLLMGCLAFLVLYLAGCGKKGPEGIQGPAGQNGISIQWLGSLSAPPSSPVLNDAYHNTTDKISYVWDGDSWEILAEDGSTGPEGDPGNDGTSIQWLGTLNSPPADPQLNFAYYSSADGVTYIWDGNSWEILAESGPQGPTGLTGPAGPQGPTGLTGPAGPQGPTGLTGANGISVNWKGSLASPPSSPVLNDAYYNSTLKKSYIWDGDSWETLAQDGAAGPEGQQGIPGVEGIQGIQGKEGADGFSVNWLGSYASAPTSPVFNDGYYNTVDKTAYVWNGTGWQVLIKDGANGISLFWLGSYASAPTEPTLNDAYYNSTIKKSYIWDGDSWETLAQDGIDGITMRWLGSLAAAPGSPGLLDAYYNTTNKTSYVWDGDSWEILAQDGVTMHWVGSFAAETDIPHPHQLNDAYYNSTLKKSYIWDGDSWEILAQDGIDGVTMRWLGSLAAAPGSPGLLDAYYNTTNKTSYVWDGDSWEILAQDGITMHWLGSLASPPGSPSRYDVYYNTTDKKSYIWDGDSWEVLTQDGVTMHWMGSFAVETDVPHPHQLNDAYYNSTDRKSYIWDGDSWEILTQDGVTMHWVGSFAVETDVPHPHQLNDAYYNSTDRKSYIWDGDSWEILTQDGVTMHWVGSFAVETDVPHPHQLNDAYYNSTDRKSYIWDGDSWEILAQDGVTMHWIGTFALEGDIAHPHQLYDAYYNSTDRKTYIWDGDSWEILAQDGLDVAPYVVYTEPNYNETGVKADTTIKVVFNKEMAPATINGSTFLVTYGYDYPITGTISCGSRTATFTPSAKLYRGTRYTFIIKAGVTDLAAQPMGFDYTGTFVTDSEAWSSARKIEQTNDDALNPQVVIDANGNALVVWEQDDGTEYSIFSVLYMVGVGWGTAELVEQIDTGPASKPQVAADPIGYATAVWEQDDGVRINVYASRYMFGTGAWSEPVRVSNDGGSIANPQVAMDSNSNAIAAWQQTEGGRVNLYASRYNIGTGLWSAQTLIESRTEDALYPQVAMDPAGNAILVWQQSNGTRVSIYYSRYNAGTGLWSAPALLETDDSQNAANPQVAMDPAGNAIAVWAQRMTSATRISIHFSRYNVGTGLWSAPALLEADETGDAANPQVAMDSYGNAIAVWQQTVGGVVNIYANRFNSGTGLWSGPVILETGAGDAVDPQVAMDRDGNAVAVWTQADTSAYLRIYSNRYNVATGLWGVYELIESLKGDTFAPQVAMDRQNNAVAVWYQYDGNRNNIAANRFD